MAYYLVNLRCNDAKMMMREDIYMSSRIFQSVIIQMKDATDRVIGVTFGIGSALAAAGGVLVGVYYNSIDPLMGIMPGLKAFVAAVLGGIGSLPGAVVGGLILGVIEAFVSGFLSSTFRDAAAFAILILVLLFRPSGIFGRDAQEKV